MKQLKERKPLALSPHQGTGAINNERLFVEMGHASSLQINNKRIKTSNLSMERFAAIDFEDR